MVTRALRWALLVGTAGIAAVTLVAGCASRAHLPLTAAAAAWPPAPEQPRIFLVGAFGRADEVGLVRSGLGRVIDWIADPGERRLGRPYAVAVTGTEPDTGPGGVGPGPAAIAVTDTLSRSVHVFDLAAREHRVITEVSEGRGLISPVGVAFDAARRVYVCDSGLATVVRYRADGELDRVLSESFARPSGLAVDPTRGFLYVADAAEHVVRKFDLEGKPLGDVKAEFRFPAHLGVTADGRLLVCDSLAFRVVVVGPDGTVQSSIGQLGDGSGDLQRPKGVALDSEGHVYVADALFDNVQIFAPDGTYLLPFGSRGTGPGELSLPAGIAIDERDLVYVADSYNGRVQVFRYIRE